MRSAFLPLGLLVLAACSSSPASSDAGAGRCTLSLSGNIDDQATVDGCASIAFQADAGTTGGWVFVVDTSTTKIGRLKVVIDLGAAPSVGTFTSASVSDWWAIGLSSSANCEFVAAPGNAASFSLALSSVDAGDAGASTVHGSLSLQLPVQAGDGTDCGPHDVEYAEVRF